MIFIKKIGFIFLFFWSISSYSQLHFTAPWIKETKVIVEGKIDFNAVVNAGNTYWETHDKEAKGSGYKPFKRWEAYWQNYVDEQGFLPSTAEIWKSWTEQKSRSQARTSSQAITDQSNWISLGPTDFLNRSTSYLNLGRVNCVTPHPNDDNIVYVGTPSGGIWKSIDAGLTYTPLSDQLPQIGVSSIAIDYDNPDTIYIATGDDDAGDSYSVGIWKSTDAGVSWNQTDLNPNNSPSRIYELEIHATNPEILWAATNGGLFKTSNGGVTWTNVQNGAFQGVKQKPNDPTILYAITNTELFKSTDSGDTFSHSGFGLPADSARMVMDVTPANEELVYIVASTDSYGFEGIYKSTNSGILFTKMDNTEDIYESNQAWYDLAMAVSDTNENELYVGVLNVWKTSDGGHSFTKLNNWGVRNEAYTHADIHFLKFYNNELYVGSDGGFFKSSDQGSTFSDKTGNMSISQFYRVSVSKQNSNKIAGGTQDNGGFGYSNSWTSYHGGDGMEGVVDPNNDNLYYGFMQSGQTLFVNADSGASGYGGTQGYAGPTNGNWITPLAINSNSEVFAGYDQLYQFENGVFTALSNNFGTNIDVLELDPTNADIIYVATNQSLQKSTNGGATFINIFDFPNNITSIEVHNNDNNIIYVTTRGTTGKVYKSTNQGASFSDISGTLPSVVKNIIKHQVDTPSNVLYLGTSLGIYRYDDNSNDWIPFMNNLPNTSVTDLSINIPDNQIIASTYGRGIWRSTMPQTQLAENDVKLVSVENPDATLVYCGSISPQLRVKNNGQNTITQIDISYTIDNGNPIAQTWNGNLESLQETLIDLPDLEVSFGTRTMAASVTTANDFYNTNNNGMVTFLINKNEETQQVNTFETPSDELLINPIQGTLLWELGVPSGTQLNSTSSGTQAYATNLDGNYSDNTKTFLYTPCFDLTTVGNPFLKFEMAFDIENDWDLLYVEYSTDQGQNWSILGTSEDPNWYNSSRINGDGIANNCYNCVGGQWTGTNTILQEYSYDLSPLADNTNIVFRFVFHSDASVNNEGVVIDDLVVEGTTLSSSSFDLQHISVYPNPSENTFFISGNNIFNCHISINDITGKQLLSFKNIENLNTPFEIDMSLFDRGIYFLNIESNQKRLTKKLIKN